MKFDTDSEAEPLAEQWILPDWPAPDRVLAAVTTRSGGYSKRPYSGWNLGDHVGDAPDLVAANRRLLRERLRLPADPLWLRQVHGCAVAEADTAAGGCEADAVVAEQPGQVCAVLTADCLPVLICDRRGARVAAVHAGWRGLASGVLEAAVHRMRTPGPQLLAWLGPAIGPSAFEVGNDVHEVFVNDDAKAAEAFHAHGADRWLADIYHLARQRLAKLSIGFVGGGDYCTVSDPQRFFSYRRDGITGRMASLIWIGDECD